MSAAVSEKVVSYLGLVGGVLWVFVLPPPSKTLSLDQFHICPSLRQGLDEESIYQSSESVALEAEKKLLK